MNHSQQIERVCKRCGKSFIGGNASRYCSEECRSIVKSVTEKQSQESSKIRKRIQKNNKRLKKKNAKLADIVAEARAAGMNYGEYVARNGL